MRRLISTLAGRLRSEASRAGALEVRRVRLGASRARAFGVPACPGAFAGARAFVAGETPRLARPSEGAAWQRAAAAQVT